MQNRDLYCADECVHDDTSTSIGGISLTDNVSLEKDSVETIKQPRRTNLSTKDIDSQQTSTGKSTLALASLLLICVGVFIWTQLFNTTAPNVQRPATAPTPTKIVEQKSVEPALFNLDITTVPAGAQLFLNDETLGMTPTTVDLPQEIGGTLILKTKDQDRTNITGLL